MVTYDTENELNMMIVMLSVLNKASEIEMGHRPLGRHIDTCIIAVWEGSYNKSV